MNHTRTLPASDDDAPPIRRCDHLYVVLDAAAPRGGSRHALDDIDEIELGRGAAPRARRDGRRLRIDCPDAWMSTAHARLVRERAHWVVVDAGSRNGVLVNGVKQARAVALDGDLVELGRTFFVVREREPAGALDLAVTPGPLATLDPALAARFDELTRIARGPAPVIVTGPTGAGKERVARAVHDGSGRRGAFVPVNCGALPDGLVESELFGHRRGAFSGAIDHHAGLVVASDGGTLFLDEIADLPAPAQAALLRVLEEHEVRAVGATAATPVDLRVVAATHQDLAARVAAGAFREDLHARLAGFELALPPLSARRVDLGVMLAEILPAGPDRAGGAIAAPAARALLRHAWPRNVRELVRVIERARSLADGGEIQLAHLPPELVGAPAAAPPRDDRKEELAALLDQHAGNVSHVATALGIARSQLQRLLKKHGLDPSRWRR